MAEKKTNSKLSNFLHKNCTNHIPFAVSIHTVLLTLSSAFIFRWWISFFNYKLLCSQEHNNWVNIVGKVKVKDGVWKFYHFTHINVSYSWWPDIFIVSVRPKLLFSISTCKNVLNFAIGEETFFLLFLLFVRQENFASVGYRKPFSSFVNMISKNLYWIAPVRFWLGYLYNIFFYNLSYCLYIASWNSFHIGVDVCMCIFC